MMHWLQSLETWDYLFSPDMDFARQALIAALCTATAAAALSPIVVLKRLAFVGQGVSHSAFGGIGIVAVLGLGHMTGEAVVFAFCLGAALVIAAMSGRKTREDTAIGIVLVATMALGSILLGLRYELNQPAYQWYQDLIAGSPAPAGWDSILFGSVAVAGPRGMWLSIGVMALVIGAVWALRRSLMCYVFDEVAATAAGISTTRMRASLMILLALVIAAGMKLVGVVLISALLVLPGAVSLRITRTLAGTMLITWLSAVIGVAGGMILAFEFDLQPGPCIVLVLIVQYAIAAVAGVWRGTGR